LKLFVVLTLQEEGFESLSESVGVEVYQAPSESDLVAALKKKLIQDDIVEEGKVDDLFQEYFAVHEIQVIESI